MNSSLLQTVQGSIALALLMSKDSLNLWHPLKEEKYVEDYLTTQFLSLSANDSFDISLFSLVHFC